MKVFIKSQVSSFLSTVVDFGVTILLKEVAGWWYLAGTAAGTLAGGMTNFEIGRHWVYKAGMVPPLKQAWRYLLVWSGSMLLNVGSVFLLTSVARFHYLISKIIVSVVVSILFNYVLQKKFVYRKPDVA